MNLLPKTRYSLLARLASADDQQAWLEFQRIYEIAIYRRARHHGLQEADALEVVQEVMVAVHRGIATWKRSGREGSFRAWLMETARRQTLQVMRRRQAADRAVGGTTMRSALEQVAGAPCDEESNAEGERWAFFCACARVEHEVHETTWRAFWLTAVEGRSAAAVAGELGWTIGNVYSAKCRVLARIRRQVHQPSRDES